MIKDVCSERYTSPHHRNHVSSQTHNPDSQPKSFGPCLLDDESVIGLAGRVARHEHAVGEPHHSQERDSPRHFAFLPSPALLFPFSLSLLFFFLLFLVVAETAPPPPPRGSTDKNTRTRCSGSTSVAVSSSQCIPKIHDRMRLFKGSGEVRSA